jgi:two-component system nitrate/nitrite response regulator NarL
VPRLSNLAHVYVVDAEDDGDASAVPHRERPLADPSSMRVLIVDDEEDIRVLLRAQLERAGYQVAGEATDGMEALAHCERDVPDAVILDLLMPRVNGFETIPKLRSKHPDVGIVAYTAVAGDFVRNEMQRLGIPLVLKSGQFSRLDSVLRELGSLRGGGLGTTEP